MWRGEEEKKEALRTTAIAYVEVGRRAGGRRKEEGRERRREEIALTNGGR